MVLAEVREVTRTPKALLWVRVWTEDNGGSDFNRCKKIDFDAVLGDR